MEPINAKPTEIPKKTSAFSRFIRKLSIFLLLAFALFLLGYYLLGAVFTYSKGDRVGYIYKFSHKGYIFKTYEGILKTGFVNIGTQNTPNEEWNFSVTEDSVAQQISDLDQRVAVKLYYKEHYLKLFFRGDTKYFVYRMEKMETP